MLKLECIAENFCLLFFLLKAEYIFRKKVCKHELAVNWKQAKNGRKKIHKGKRIHGKKEKEIKIK